MKRKKVEDVIENIKKEKLVRIENHENLENIANQDTDVDVKLIIIYRDHVLYKTLYDNVEYHREHLYLVM